MKFLTSLIALPMLAVASLSVTALAATFKWSSASDIPTLDSHSQNILTGVWSR